MPRSIPWWTFYDLAFFGGLFMSLFVTKTLHISYIPTLWKERKNKSIKSRMICSFIAGFLLVFGARLTAGCNAGHILSGGSQLAVSGMIFAVVALGTGMITGIFLQKTPIQSGYAIFAIKPTILGGLIVGPILFV